jgi:hypothetical protein
MDYPTIPIRLSYDRKHTGFSLSKLKEKGGKRSLLSLVYCSGLGVRENHD